MYDLLLEQSEALAASLAARVYENGAAYRFLNSGAVEVRVKHIGGAPALLSSGQFRSMVVTLHILKTEGGNYACR